MRPWLRRRGRGRRRQRRPPGGSRAGQGVSLVVGVLRGGENPATVWRVLPAPPPTFPAASYYQALASLIPLLWIVLVFQARINQDSTPHEVSTDPVGVMWYLIVRLIGLIGLPWMEWGVLLVLRDGRPRGWLDGNLPIVLFASVAQIVAPVFWRVASEVLPERLRPPVRKGALVVLAALTTLWALSHPFILLLTGR